MSQASAPDTAVILAAGMGSRLHAGAGPSGSKPLTAVAGAPLILHTLRQLAAHAIQRVVIVTGYRADELTRFVRAASPVGVEVVFVQNDQWMKAGGISVLCARRHVPGEFLLLMSDHVFAPEILAGLMSDAARPPEHGAVLAIDRKIDTIFDLPDATLVQTDDQGQMLDIGKGLTVYDAVDTGLFRVTSGLFDALQAEYDRQGDCTLSDGIRQLARAGRMRLHDIQDAWWQDVDTPEMLAEAERRLGLRTGASLKQAS
jgi:1L-myo-inositol 1-phosphate cytidylyltransferase